MSQDKKYQESKDKYLREKVDELKVRVPKGEKEKIQARAKEQGKSVNAYILNLIEKAAEETENRAEIKTEQKKSTESVKTDSVEKVDIDRAEKALTELFVKIGYVKPDEDITDTQLAELKGGYRFLDHFLGGGDK